METLNGVKPHPIMERRNCKQLKVKVLKREGKELKIEIEGAGHGLCNLIQKKLLEDKGVDMESFGSKVDGKFMSAFVRARKP